MTSKVSCRQPCCDLFPSGQLRASLEKDDAHAGICMCASARALTGSLRAEWVSCNRKSRAEGRGARGLLRAFD